MACRLLDGKVIAKKIEDFLVREIDSLSADGKIKLAALAIGAHSSSEVHMKAQRKLARSLGIDYFVKKYPVSVTHDELEADISVLNRDPLITGIIIESPAPEHINIDRLFQLIAKEKDVESVNSANIGNLVSDRWRIAPPTARACLHLIESTGVELEGREVVIVGHSSIVGRPLALMLVSRLATTTVCHIGTYNRGLLDEHVKAAEILVVAVGKSSLIKGAWIKSGAIVIDVGINAKDGVIMGDVEFDEAKKNAGYITPVPGGVGPVATAMLMKNVVELYKAAEEKKNNDF